MNDQVIGHATSTTAVPPSLEADVRRLFELGGAHAVRFQGACSTVTLFTSGNTVRMVELPCMQGDCWLGSYAEWVAYEIERRA